MTITPTPDHWNYDPRYARYLAYDPEALVDRAGSLDGATVLDLACGPGRATLAALERGARRIMAVDFVHDTIDRLAREHAEITVRGCDVVTALQNLPEFYDLVLCHQAINYWLLRCPTHLLVNRLKPGGRFVFNTINTAPPAEPKSWDYVDDGRRFHETLYRVGETIYHVQSATGLAPHINFFDWIPRDTIRRLLGDQLDLVELVEGSTSIWICTRRSGKPAGDHGWTQAAPPP